MRTRFTFFLGIDLSPPSCNVTIVTAYYKIRSKHSSEEYLSWMTNFLTLQDCMVIFTQQDFVSTIQTLRPADYQTIINSIELNQELYQKISSYHDHSLWQLLKTLSVVSFYLIYFQEYWYIDMIIDIRRWFTTCWMTLNGQSRRDWTQSRE